MTLFLEAAAQDSWMDTSSLWYTRSDMAWVKSSMSSQAGLHSFLNTSPQ